MGGRAGVAAAAAGAAREGRVDVDRRLARRPQPGGGGVRAEGLPQGEQHLKHVFITGLHLVLASHMNTFKAN